VTRVSIRRALPADADRVSTLARQTFPLACPPGTTRENIEVFCDTKLSEEAFDGYLADPHIRIWLATTEVEPVGYLMNVGGGPPDTVIAGAVRMRPTVEISKIYVLESSHGSGVASRLMSVAVEDARTQGAQSVWLGVNKHNERANRFYERQGFVIVGERSFQVGESLEDDFVREKVLQSPRMAFS